jgi:hypothetical protein
MTDLLVLGVVPKAYLPGRINHSELSGALDAGQRVRKDFESLYGDALATLDAHPIAPGVHPL